jgi:aspartyl-tRNA(Asn)/glutamyl-tRNA(Gln) amidotransferase subunit C
MLSREEIKHIAGLARIEFTEEEEERHRKEMSAILEYVAKLDELDTDGVEPIGHITGMVNVLREDVVREASDDEKRQIMENVPEKKDGCIRVKQVLGRGDRND